MRYHASIVAVASIALDRAAASYGGGANGANWYLRAPDGSSQGPYALPQLGEWSSAGYVSRDSQVQWGPGGVPEPLSNVLGSGGRIGGGGRGSMSGASTVPVRGAGGRYGGGVSDEGGRHGDDDTSEEGGYDYKAAARQLWSGQGDDSDEDEPNTSPGEGRRRGSPGTRDEWGSLMSSKVTAVEGGRWSESVAAAKGTFRKMFSVTGRRRNNDGDSRSRRGGGNDGRGYRGAGPGGRGRYAQGARGGRGRGPSQERGNPYSDKNGGGSRGYGGRGQAGGMDASRIGGRGAPGDWSDGRGAMGGGGGGGGGGAGGNSNAWSNQNQHASSPPMMTPQARVGQQMDVAAASGMSGASGASGPVFGGGPMTGSGIGSQGSAYPPPPPPPPPEEQRDGLPPQQEGDRGSGQQATRQTEEGVSRGDSGSDIASIPSPPHTTGDGATGAGGASALYPPPPPPGQQQPQQYAGQDPTQIGQAFPPPPPPGFDSGAGMPGGRSGAEEGPVRVTGTTDGLDPKEVEAFFAAQAEYGNSGSPPVDATPSKQKKGWGRGRKDIPKEDLTAMGLKYGEADRRSQGRQRRRWGFKRGRRGALAGRISVDSMRMKYAEGWTDEADSGGVFATLRGVAGSSVSCVSSPTRMLTSMAPIAATRTLAAAGGVFPLLLWLAFSTARGVLPVLVAWLFSRSLDIMAEASQGRYVFSPAEYQRYRLECLAMAAKQAGSGLLLALSAGVVRGWLRPRTREACAALGRRVLAGVCIAGGNDRPRAAEFRELSLAPWAYMCQAINLWQNIAGVAACAYVSHLVWPLRGPVALGGGAAALLFLESLAVWLSRNAESDSALDKAHCAFAEEIAGGFQGGAVASSEAQARGLKQVLLDKHASSLESAEDTGRRKVLTVFSVLRGIVMFLTMGAGAVYAILALVEEELAYQFGSARILLVGSLVWIALHSLQRALGCVGSLSSLLPAASRMHAMALSSNAEGSNKDTGLGTAGGWANDGPEMSDGLRLEAVSFIPHGRATPALSQVDVHAPAGTVVAILGGAGSGKTALLQLILGMVKADVGKASFQGRPLGEWETSAYRERLAWLSQVPARFPVTAGENIGAGDPSEFSNRQLWARAAGLSGANGPVESLPLGYDTLLQEGGGPAAGVAETGRGPIGSSGLSEGEWQRLHLARFLMRADVAKLLVLDEPFQGIDPSDATRMLAALGAQARATGQVVVVASQDMSIGRWADKCVLMQGGSVFEAGAWDDLLARGGSFAAAVREHDAL